MTKKPKETLHIWLAQFDSPEAFDEFFEEDYSDEDDDKPISKFAASQDVTFYDHDWLEHMLDTKKIGQDAFIENTLPSRYVEAVKTVAKQQSIKDANGIIMFYEEWSGTPKSKDGNPTLWYLGEFNEETLKAFKSPDAYQSGSVEKDWWTSFPKTDEDLAALEKQSRKRKDQMPAVAKLVFMYTHGIYGESDTSIAQKYRNKIEAYPEVMHEFLMANAEAGNTDSDKAAAWLELFHLHGRETDISVDKARRLEFLNKAIELGSGQAEFTLAQMMMYSWTSPYNFEEDYDKTEELYLSAYEKSACKPYELYCFYSSKVRTTENQSDAEEAFKWLKISVDKTGSSASFSRLSEMYKEGNGVKQDLVQMYKYIYLSLCQDDDNRYLKYHLEKLALCDSETIQSGRDDAKKWIEEFAGQATHFQGELSEPFEEYLNQ